MDLSRQQCSFEERPEIRWRRDYAKGIPSFSSKLQANEIVSAWCGGGKMDWSAGLFGEYLSEPHHRVPAAHEMSPEAEMIVQHIFYAAVDQELRDEDEPAPSCEVIQKAFGMIYAADKLLGVMPYGQVSTFFGEINVTWRGGDRIVRLACFQDRPTILQTGSFSDPLGHYNSRPNPSPLLLADELQGLV
jgi:hypothetical protein